jgi:hypothetical protein
MIFVVEHDSLDSFTTSSSYPIDRVPFAAPRRLVILRSRQNSPFDSPKRTSHQLTCDASISHYPNVDLLDSWATCDTSHLPQYGCRRVCAVFSAKFMDAGIAV